jgi:hypothetical protein
VKHLQVLNQRRNNIEEEHCLQYLFEDSFFHKIKKKSLKDFFDFFTEVKEETNDLK